ncbi:MAG TPA: hypothetical protein VH277_02700 [Gemmatimonadaceae bacterium]|nr:hypothetical protein [Gemmatimonadaceae bacterium]
MQSKPARSTEDHPRAYQTSRTPLFMTLMAALADVAITFLLDRRTRN